MNYDNEYSTFVSFIVQEYRWQLVATCTHVRLLKGRLVGCIKETYSVQCLLLIHVNRLPSKSGSQSFNELVPSTGIKHEYVYHEGRKKEIFPGGKY